MNKWSKQSEERLRTCAVELQILFDAVVMYHDCTVVYGYRSPEEQAQLYAAGKSKLQAGKSKHNIYPSRAIDVAPYIPGVGMIVDDVKYFYLFAGVVFTVAQIKDLRNRIRWGGDWDRDGNLNDQTFNDLYHWELVD